MSETTYPYLSGDVTVLGPEVFTNGEVIYWKGENFVRQQGADIPQAVRDLAAGVVWRAMDEWDRANPGTLAATMAGHVADSLIADGLLRAPVHVPVTR